MFRSDSIHGTSTGLSENVMQTIPLRNAGSEQKNSVRPDDLWVFTKNDDLFSAFLTERHFLIWGLTVSQRYHLTL